MKINTEKIQKEMRRVGITLEQLSMAIGSKDRQVAWYLIHHAKKMESIERIATALDMDAKDLLK